MDEVEGWDGTFDPIPETRAVDYDGCTPSDRARFLERWARDLTSRKFQDFEAAGFTPAALSSEPVEHPHALHCHLVMRERVGMLCEHGRDYCDVCDVCTCSRDPAPAELDYKALAAQLLEERRLARGDAIRPLPLDVMLDAYVNDVFVARYTDMEEWGTNFAHDLRRLRDNGSIDVERSVFDLSQHVRITPRGVMSIRPEIRRYAERKAGEEVAAREAEERQARLAAERAEAKTKTKRILDLS